MYVCICVYVYVCVIVFMYRYMYGDITGIFITSSILIRFRGRKYRGGCSSARKSYEFSTPLPPPVPELWWNMERVERGSIGCLLMYGKFFFPFLFQISSYWKEIRIIFVYIFVTKYFFIFSIIYIHTSMSIYKLYQKNIYVLQIYRSLTSNYFEFYYSRLYIAIVNVFLNDPSTMVDF